MRDYTYRAALRAAAASGQDAGNKSAQRNGRTEWNADDWNAAAERHTLVMAALGFAPGATS